MIHKAALPSGSRRKKARKKEGKKAVGAWTKTNKKRQKNLIDALSTTWLDLTEPLYYTEKKRESNASKLQSDSHEHQICMQFARDWRPKSNLHTQPIFYLFGWFSSSTFPWSEGPSCLPGTFPTTLAALAFLVPSKNLYCCFGKSWEQDKLLFVLLDCTRANFI